MANKDKKNISRTRDSKFTRRSDDTRPTNVKGSQSRRKSISGTKTSTKSLAKETNEIVKKENIATAKKSRDNGSIHSNGVSVVSVAILLVVDIVIVVVVGLLCYLQSKNSTSLKGMLMWFGVFFIVGIIAHIILDITTNRKNSAADAKKGGTASTSHASMYLVVSMLMILSIGVVLLSIYNQNLKTDKIYNGVYVNEVNVAGLSYDEVLDIVKSSEQESLNNISLNLYVDDELNNITADQMGLYSNVDETVNVAYYYARTGGIFDRIDKVLRLRSEAANFTINYSTNSTYVDSIAQQIADSVYAQVVDAQHSFTPENEGANSPGAFTLVDEVVGRYISKDDIVATIQNSCQSMNFSDVYMHSVKTDPSVYASTIKESTVLLGTFTTNLEDDDNRTSNVDLASTTIEKVVMPGETFSFNETTGERTLAKGYKVAHAIANGTTLVDAVAGGVCQVASTLHAALLNTDIPIVERHNHSFKVGYMDVGMDATVDFFQVPSLNFMFYNNTGHPLYISSFVTYNEPDKDDVTTNNLTINIYGTVTDPNTMIVARVEVLESYAGVHKYEYTTKVPSGEKVYLRNKISGKKTSTYRDYYVDGVLVKSELLYEEDIYHSVNGLTLIGTG